MPDLRRWPRARVFLALVGLALLLLSVALLAYAFWPTGTLIEQFQPPATLFAPPSALALPPRWL